MPNDETDLQKHTLNLFSGDYARLQELYPDIGAGPVIRRLIRQFIQQAEQPGESPAAPEINL